MSIYVYKIYIPIIVLTSVLSVKSSLKLSSVSRMSLTYYSFLTNVRFACFHWLLHKHSIFIFDTLKIV